MAPKNKFTRAEMTAAALGIVRADGAEHLTAKTLAAALGISTQPVFTCFGSMEGVHQAVRDAARQVYDDYITAGLREEIPFFGLGMQYIHFAREEPMLYRLLFLAQTPSGGAFAALEHSQALARPSLERIYHLTAAEADRYFRDLWLVVHSLATLIVTGGCPYTDREIGQILTGFSLSICKSIKEVPGFAAGITSLALGAGTLRLGGVTIRGLVRVDTSLSEGALYAAMTAGLIVMAGEAVLSRFAAGYFAQALADGTPFRAESARSLLRLGILTICIPLGTQILAEIACAVLEKTSSGAVELPLGADGSVVLGVMFIVLSLVCRCAAEQMEVQK